MVRLVAGLATSFFRKKHLARVEQVGGEVNPIPDASVARNPQAFAKQVPITALTELVTRPQDGLTWHRDKINDRCMPSKALNMTSI